MNIRQWRLQAKAKLANSDSPLRDAEILLEFVTGRSRTWLIAFDETVLATQHLSRLETLLTRRAEGEPIAYITGRREFWSLPLLVNSSTLIPRPESELLVELALARLAVVPATVLDLGCGSGALALAIASERTDCHITGVDCVAQAVELARKNAQCLGLRNCRFIQSDWFNALPSNRFDLIVSNPPYLADDDPHLQRGDVRFEPKSALIAEEAGEAALSTIIEAAVDWLVPQGWLLLEHGWQQAQRVRQLLAKNYTHVETRQDLARRDRVTIGRLKMTS